jgi:hypothetical protein
MKGMVKSKPKIKKEDIEKVVEEVKTTCPQCGHKLEYHSGSGCMPPEVAKGKTVPCGCRYLVSLESLGQK